MTKSLSGKTALITGSTSGIGLGYARALAGAGAKVMINGFGDQAVIDGYLAELIALNGEGAAHSGADMTKPQDIRDMVEECTRQFGSPDILINNAGIQHVAPIDEFPEDKWDAILAIILSSAYHSTKAALPGMKAKGWGRVVNIASLNGVNAHVGTADYNVAKEGLRALTRTAAREWAPYGICCNIICPAALADSMRRVMAQQPGMIEAIESANPMGRMGDPEADIAPVAAFLASDDARYVTGNTLFVDGGGHINGVAWAPHIDD